MSSEPDVATSDDATAASAHAEHVSMVYQAPGHGGLPALEDITLDLEPGTFCSIVGPSGCGKSTFLMLLAGLYHPTTGEIDIDDIEVTEPLDGLGIVFQRDALLEWRSVLDNVLLPIEVKRLGVKNYKDRALELLDLVGLSEFEDYYPQKLSGGMRQRVAICRSLVHDPRLLLMDEPFAAVDALTRERLNFDLLRLTGGRSTTVVFVTHSIEEAVLLSDRILVMSPRPGRVEHDIAVDLPKPRAPETKNLERFYEYVQRIRSMFHSMGLF